jgi:hypothetical protein
MLLIDQQEVGSHLLLPIPIRHLARRFAEPFLGLLILLPWKELGLRCHTHLSTPPPQRNLNVFETLEWLAKEILPSKTTCLA